MDGLGATPATIAGTDTASYSAGTAVTQTTNHPRALQPTEIESHPRVFSCLNTGGFGINDVSDHSFDFERAQMSLALLLREVNFELIGGVGTWLESGRLAQ